MKDLSLTSAIAKMKRWGARPQPKTTTDQRKEWDAMSNEERNAFIAKANQLAADNYTPVESEPFAPTLIAMCADGSRFVLDGLIYKTTK